MQKMKSEAIRFVNERGWYLMDMMERSQSLNREALINILQMANRQTGGVRHE